jgi:hypothetical protein
LGRRVGWRRRRGWGSWERAEAWQFKRAARAGGKAALGGAAADLDVDVRLHLQVLHAALDERDQGAGRHGVGVDVRLVDVALVSEGEGRVLEA